MVLPDRIELSTSPLPMECSTTELRQRARITGVGQIGPTRRPILATRPLLAQARGLRCADRGGAAAACFDRAMGWPIRFPRLAARRRRLDRADHDLEFDHFAGFVASARSIPSSCQWFMMTNEKDGDRPDSVTAKRTAGQAAEDSRQDRLKRALRDNLRRRKSQARARSEPTPASSPAGDGAPYDGGGSQPGERD